MRLLLDCGNERVGHEGRTRLVRLTFALCPEACETVMEGLHVVIATRVSASWLHITKLSTNNLE